LLASAHTIAAELSSCTHLATITHELIHEYYQQLEQQLASELSQQLAKAQWPSPRPIIAGIVETVDEEFENSFVQLIDVQIAYEAAVTVMHKVIPDCEIAAKHSLKALKVLFEPLLIRFRFHFMEKHATNRLDKPEWMYTHMLSVFRDHRDFMKQCIQPMLDEHCSIPVDAYTELMKSLVQLAQSKLKQDLLIVLQDEPALFHHYITETVAFEQGINV